jgi:hypothetical protein
MRTSATFLATLAILSTVTCADPQPTEVGPFEADVAVRAGKGAPASSKTKSVTVSPGSASIEVGATVQLTGASKPPGATLAWASSNSSVATVSQSGLVSGVSAGTATVSASAGGKSGSAAITVTAPPPAGEVMFAAGDIASCTNNNDEATAQILDANPVGTVAILGDNAYESGTATEFTSCYHPTWGRHFARTKPSVGNHEYQTPGATGYYGYFGSTAGDPAKGYYSYDLGAWHIIVLNSNIARDSASAQVQWLRADLQANSGKACTLAYWHHPRFSSGQHGNDVTQAALWDTLHAYDADVILNGHEHNYERFAPQNPSGGADNARGIREFIVGTGGRELRTKGTTKANSQVFSSAAFGVLKLTLSAASYSWQFIPIAGQSFSDSGSASCH